MILKLKSVKLIVLLIAISHKFRIISSANILFFFGIGTYSHKYAAWPWAIELGKRGHNVTFLSAYDRSPIDSKFVTNLAPKVVQNMVKSAFSQEKIQARQDGQELDIWFGLPDWSLDICKFLFTSDDSQLNQLIRGQPFDLIVINGIFADCGYLYAQLHGAKTIIFDSTTVLQWQYDIIGAPIEASYIPDPMIGYPQPMSYLSRFMTSLWPLYWHFTRQWLYFPKLNQILKDRVGNDDHFRGFQVNDLRGTEKDISLIVMNTHYSTDYARSLPPMVILAGGMQCWLEDRKVPKDIANFMDNSEKGVILITFGSSVPLSEMPDKFIQMFFDMMVQFPEYNFIWKYEKELPKNAPKNFIGSNFLPQKEILSHPKMKLFITHCGLLSIQEAMYNGIPIVGLPLFAEQDYNAGRVLLTGIGLIREFKGLEKSVLIDAVREVLQNPIYQNNMLNHQKIFKNRLRPPIETAVFYTEFILENDASVLKPLSAHQAWYEYRLLDIYFVMFSITLLLAFFIAKIVFCLIKCAFFNKTTSTFAKIDKNKNKNKLN